MANLIIKSSADNLVLQGSDASPALTVAADGQTTFAEPATMSGTLGVTGNTTLSGTANNVGTVTGGTIDNAVAGVTTKIFGFSAKYTTDADYAENVWTEVTANGTWTERWDTNGKLASGRFTPTVQGIYLIGYNFYTEYLDNNEYIQIQIRINSSADTSDPVYAHQRVYSFSDSNFPVTVNAQSLVQLDTNDWVSIYARHNQGPNMGFMINSTEWWGYYVGAV